jgi:hypothetical protein
LSVLGFVEKPEPDIKSSNRPEGSPNHGHLKATVAQTETEREIEKERIDIER